MDRRNFFKIVSATGAAAVTTACGPDTDKLIPLLVPEDQLVPGEEQWHPAVCNECSAGCGTIVRVMEGRRKIQTPDGLAMQRRAAIKKIEGNPLDPISGGKLCARGQAVIQALYHPDRLKQAWKREGARGAAKYATITWDDAITQAADEISKAGPEGIVFLTGSQTGTRSLAIEKFLAALKAPPPIVCALDDHAPERVAAKQFFDWDNLPVYDIANASTILSVGADFLGSWTSPVYYTRQYGEFRRGRKTVRGRLIHAESRMSLTAASADRWLPLKPGTEALFLAGLTKLIRAQKTSDAFDLKDLAEETGIPARMLEETANALLDADAPLVIGGASIVHSNSVDAIVLAHALNTELGANGLIRESEAVLTRATSPLVLDKIAKAKVLLVDGTNPAYILPGGTAALANVETIISFSPFVDDTAAHADLLLPDNHYLESETALVPSVSSGLGASVSTPFVRPLHDTRPVEQTLADIAAALELEYERVKAADVTATLATDELPQEEIARQGGAWQPASRTQPATVKPVTPAAAPAAFSGDANRFPLHFQAYLSLQFHDGRSANLPWMQELPDPASSAMWGLPVEIDPKTAQSLGIRNGDRVKVDSPHGSLEAPAYVNPAAVPGVVSMAIGSGHKNYTRYASHGANPLSILDPSAVPVRTGGVRVKLVRLGSGSLTQYSAKDTEHHQEVHR
jgi:anaerobic selenocysteine-containing dehydrogenase